MDDPTTYMAILLFTKPRPAQTRTASKASHPRVVRRHHVRLRIGGARTRHPSTHFEPHNLKPPSSGTFPRRLDAMTLPTQAYTRHLILCSTLPSLCGSPLPPTDKTFSACSELE